MQFHPETILKRVSTRLGTVHLAASPHGVCGLWFEGQRHAPDGLVGTKAWPEVTKHPLLENAAQQLQDWLAGQRRTFDLPLDWAGGTRFQQSVWRALQGIAWGNTSSYRDIAIAIQSPDSARAVGAAVGRNPLSLIVPCHRVIASNGALTGYAGGIERKLALLEMEKRASAAESNKIASSTKYLERCGTAASSVAHA